MIYPDRFRICLGVQEVGRARTKSGVRTIARSAFKANPGIDRRAFKVEFV